MTKSKRFGVELKERLKSFRKTVDVLTMTATPIPRTLHMALVGLRDISALHTPPQDRLAVETHVCRFDPELVRHAVLRELSRQGQIFSFTTAFAISTKWQSNCVSWCRKPALLWLMPACPRTSWSG